MPQNHLAECGCHCSTGGRSICYVTQPGLHQNQQQRRAALQERETQLLQMLERHADPSLPAQTFSLASRLCRQFARLQTLREEVDMLNQQQQQMQKQLLIEQAIGCGRQAARAACTWHMLRLQQQQQQASDTEAFTQWRLLLQQEEAQDLHQLQGRLLAAQQDLLRHRHMKRKQLVRDAAANPVLLEDTHVRQQRLQLSCCRRTTATTRHCATGAPVDYDNSFVIAPAFVAAAELAQQKTNLRPPAAGPPAAATCRPPVSSRSSTAAEVSGRRRAKPLVSVLCAAVCAEDTVIAAKPGVSAKPAASATTTPPIADAEEDKPSAEPHLVVVGSGPVAPRLGLHSQQKTTNISTELRHCATVATPSGCVQDEACCGNNWRNNIEALLDHERKNNRSEHPLKKKQLLRRQQRKQETNASSSTSSSCSSNVFRNSMFPLHSSERNDSIRGRSERRRSPLQTSSEAFRSLMDVGRLIKTDNNTRGNETYNSHSEVGARQSTRQSSPSVIQGLEGGEEELFELELEIQILQHELPALEQLQEKAMRSVALRYYHTEVYPPTSSCRISSSAHTAGGLELGGTQHSQRHLQEQQRLRRRRGATTSRFRVPWDANNTRQHDERQKPQQQTKTILSNAALTLPRDSSSSPNCCKHQEFKCKIDRGRGTREKQLHHVKVTREANNGTLNENINSNKGSQNKPQISTAATSNVKRDNTDCVLKQQVLPRGTAAARGSSGKSSVGGDLLSLVEQKCPAAAQTARIGEYHAGCHRPAPSIISHNRRTKGDSFCSSAGAGAAAPAIKACVAANSDSSRRCEGTEETQSLRNPSIGRRKSHQRIRAQTMQTRVKPVKAQQRNVLRDETAISFQRRKYPTCSGRQQPVPQNATPCESTPVVTDTQELKTVVHQQRQEGHYSCTEKQPHVGKHEAGVKKTQEHRHQQPPNQRIHLLHPRQRLQGAGFPDSAKQYDERATGRPSSDCVTKATAVGASGKTVVSNIAARKEAIIALEVAASRHRQSSPNDQYGLCLKAKTPRGSETSIVSVGSSQQQQQQQPERQHEDTRLQRVTGVLDHVHQQKSEKEQPEAMKQHPTGEYHQPHTGEQVVASQQMRERWHAAETQQHECSGLLLYTCTASPFGACLSSQSLFLRSSSSSCSSPTDETE